MRFEELGVGSISLVKEKWGISIVDFTINWNNVVPKIIDLYFGTSRIPEGRQSIMNIQNSSFSADWEAFGYCVPGAKEGTVQSYFRNWDFGQSDISLGNFAPSMGTPYGAAFPRPVLALAMGNGEGMMTIGAGGIPDAPMTLKTRSALGCLHFLYREDLWGSGSKERFWENPLRIAFGKNAWISFKNYFSSFPEKKQLSENHVKAIWNTWGNWRNKEYPIPPIADFAKKVGAEMLNIDDPWESFQGSGKPNTTLFPQIKKDLEKVYENNMTYGIRETLGWIGNPEACGLQKEDLILDYRGNPCITSWNFNPFAPGNFCLDISSQRSRDFL